MVRLSVSVKVRLGSGLARHDQVDNGALASPRAPYQGTDRAAWDMEVEALQDLTGRVKVTPASRGRVRVPGIWRPWF